MFMKVNEFVKKAESAVDAEVEELVIEKIKDFKKDIRSCKKTLKSLEVAYASFLDSDVEDLELDGFEY